MPDAEPKPPPRDWRVFWNDRFEGDAYRFGTAPNRHLESVLPRAPAPPAEALALGDGEGRNGVHLARAGYQTTTVDLSPRGLAKARALAEQAGVAIRTIEADLAEWSPPPGRFAVVALIYVHLPELLRRAVHRAACQALVPGGIFVFEAFHQDQRSMASGGPRDPLVLYDAAMLRGDLEGMRILELLEGEVWLDEGQGHQGPARIVRALAQRPAGAP